jgi:hypothetical protein
MGVWVDGISEQMGVVVFVAVYLLWCRGKGEEVDNRQIDCVNGME